MSQDNTASPRYQIVEATFDGVLHSAGELIPFGNGQGHLRNIVLEVPGVYNDLALVPVTLFNDLAKRIDPERDTGKEVACVARLRSSQYVDKNGVQRWDLSFAGSYIRVKDPDVSPNNPTTFIRDDDFEDLPF